jgi:hypothetical protein
MTTTLLDLLVLLPVHSAAIVGLWRAAYFPLRTSPDPRGWPRRLPFRAVDLGGAGVLWPLRYVVERYLPAWLQKPLMTCPACMATVYGPLPFAWAFGGFASAPWFLYIGYWPALSCAAAAWAVVVNPER